MNSTALNPNLNQSSSTLLPYQLSWLSAPDRFKIGLWARQTGKDHTCTAEAVIDCILHAKNLWIILAAGERQALESMAKAREWTHHFHSSLANYEEHFTPAARLTSAQITFPNGSRLIALPANPATIRGYSGNLILTEFAYHEKPDEIWRAIYPSISNPLRGGLKKVRIISTPNGMNNKFAQLWFNAPYFKQKVTMEEAVRAGLPIDIDDLKAGLNDPEAWAQEYECNFMDSSSVLLPYELITPCESADATENNSPQGLSTMRGELYAGIDFGRKRHLTVCWIFERVPAHRLLGLAGRDSPRAEDIGRPHDAARQEPRSAGILTHLLLTREVLVLRDMSTPEQVNILRHRLSRVRRACVDYTGAGVGLGDYLVNEFGEYRHGRANFPARRGSAAGCRPAVTYRGKIELCQFTTALKGELFPKLRAAFESRTIRIPSSHAIREDLHAIQKVVTANGAVAYRALSSSDGHSDRCTALALALRAAEAGPVSQAPTVVYSRNPEHERHCRSLAWLRRNRL